MADPICRVQNPYPKNVVKLVHNLPHSEMSNDEFKEYMKSSEYGYDSFFKTYYQLACQLGLYYIDDEYLFHPRFKNDIDEEQAEKYLIFWFSRYYVPNPYTRGFSQLSNPILVEDTLYEYIKNNGNSKDVLQICKDIFKETIGNPDIFINAINSFSHKLKVTENHKFEIKNDKEVCMETANNRDDKKAFFNSFDKDSNSNIPFPHNRIIFGAPGTGKSHKLQEDVDKYFSPSINYESLLKEEIKNRPQEKEKEPWFNHIGIKYASYIYKRTREETEENLQLQWGVSQNELWKMKTAARATIDYKHSVFNESFDKAKYYERVTFHPNYSYAQFVGTYKPIIQQVTNLSEEQKLILSTLTDKSKTAQEKYDLLYTVFKGENLTRLPILIGLYDDGLFHTKKTDETPAANDNIVERNHGKAIRPYVNIENVAKEEISYEYVPGPFIRTFIKAKKTGQNVLLLIEEINRANVAAVFGDAFQLLDRDENGNSEYPITTNEDLRKFLAKPENLGGSLEDYTTLSIPNNMYIWATMNSADQGVFPMDTAFKRRWDFEYIGIDENAEKLVYDDGKPILIPIPSKNGKETKDGITYDLIEWNKFRTEINRKLSENTSVNEDKLLGPFFISLDKLRSAKDNPSDFIKCIKSKVLMYLFEDVVKISPAKLFKNCGEHPRYSDICSKFDEIGAEIFGISEESIITPTETANDEQA